MIAYILPLLLYGGLALLAVWATWRDEDLRWVGAWLLLGFLISNALYFGHVKPVYRTGPYTFLEVMVAIAAFCALNRHPRWPIAILVFNLLSIAANIGLILAAPATRQQIYSWNLTTNLAFAAECLLAIGAGGGYARIVDSVRSWLPSGRRVAQQGAAEKEIP